MKKQVVLFVLTYLSFTCFLHAKVDLSEHEQALTNIEAMPEGVSSFSDFGVELSRAKYTQYKIRMKRLVELRDAQKELADASAVAVLLEQYKRKKKAFLTRMPRYIRLWIFHGGKILIAATALVGLGSFAAYKFAVRKHRKKMLEVFEFKGDRFGDGEIAQNFVKNILNENKEFLLPQQREMVEGLSITPIADMYSEHYNRFVSMIPTAPSEKRELLREMTKLYLGLFDEVLEVPFSQRLKQRIAHNKVMNKYPGLKPYIQLLERRKLDLWYIVDSLGSSENRSIVRQEQNAPDFLPSLLMHEALISILEKELPLRTNVLERLKNRTLELARTAVSASYTGLFKTEHIENVSMGIAELRDKLNESIQPERREQFYTLLLRILEQFHQFMSRPDLARIPVGKRFALGQMNIIRFKPMFRAFQKEGADLGGGYRASSIALNLFGMTHDVDYLYDYLEVGFAHRLQPVQINNVEPQDFADYIAFELPVEYQEEEPSSGDDE